MTITTKFDVGDTAFIMHENKVAEVEIDQIEIRSELHDFLTVTSTSYRHACPTGGLPHHRTAHSLFTTKEELLASL